MRTESSTSTEQTTPQAEAVRAALWRMPGDGGGVVRVLGKFLSGSSRRPGRGTVASCVPPARWPA